MIHRRLSGICSRSAGRIIGNPAVVQTAVARAAALVPRVVADQPTINDNAKDYLNGTDWYEVRSINGKPMPLDIAEKRQAARDSIIILQGTYNGVN